MLTKQALVAESTKLVSLPAIYLKLKQVIDDPKSGMRDVAEVVSLDPALTARLLRMVNSAYFGFGQNVDTVSHAVNMLGSQQIHDLALATAVADTFTGISSDDFDNTVFWQNSVYCGVLARLLAGRCNVLDSERLFVAGLLREIGHLVMYQCIADKMQQVISRVKQSGLPFYRVEKELIGFDFAELGAELMQNWVLPESLQVITHHQMTPSKAKGYELEAAIVHIAGSLADNRQNKSSSHQTEVHIEPAAWQITGLAPADLTLIEEEAELQLAPIVTLLFPSA